MTGTTRRQFLTAATGLVPIPFLASLHGGCVDSPLWRRYPLVVMRAASGVAQADGDEPEQWWPRTLGPLTERMLAVDNADRVTSELASHADRLLMVRGTRFPFKASRELHAGGGNQLLTAAQPGPLSDSVMTFALGESIDNWIARQRQDVNGGEPLTLYAGRRDNYGEEVLSYRGPEQLRGAESDPWAVYQRLLGAGGAQDLRTSVNDLVLDQLDALMRDPRLSAEDLTRLELHTDSVRDFEVLAGRLSEETEAAMADLAGKSAMDAYSLDVARLHCDLIALVLACDQATAVTLQVGDRLDRANYTIDGQVYPSYHEITHRLVDDEDIARLGTAVEMHAAVNRLHLQVYSYLLDRLEERGLLDTSIAVFCSDVATGSHRYDQVPWVLAGTGDGSLRNGQYIDAGNVTHDRLLATLLTATGHRTPDGDPIERFGDASLDGGLLDVMLQT